ncbi:MAG: type II toxin-antitoxin system RelE/ParE family toxin [Maricaulis sp.]|jgi:hypothetical protein|nr:type II toxin-antitoxin system RelE/ParE family toxin [uncultured Maricaulis sp.]MDF1768999.1 type II toxin-antitoxin system RelE/ParE family toxin [Maricaulis sp.]
MKVVRLSSFDRSARKAGVTEGLVADLARRLVEDPTVGDVIKGTGGVRKVRFALPGRGRSGGGRAIYLALVVEETIFLILAYKKASQEDLTAEQKKRIRALVEELKR